MNATAVDRPMRRIEGSGLGDMADPSRMQIVEILPLSERVTQFTLAREDGGAFTFAPGQFCRIGIPGADGELWRNYSIATPVASGIPSRTCDIAVSATPGEAATDYLFTRQTGQILRVSGPFGRFVLPPDESPHYVLAGTGTGMAPYRAMLPELERRAREQPVRVTLLMGVRTRGERIYGDEFAKFAGRSHLWNFIVCYSQDRPASGEPLEYRGYVQDTLRRLPLTPGQEHVYLCGNPKMIDECSRSLSRRGFEKHYLMRDECPGGGTAWF